MIELLPLAALDRLEPDEALRLDEHMREGCAQCDSELRAWREVTAALAMVPEPAGVEHRVWQRLEARLRKQAAAAHSLASSVSRPRQTNKLGERQPDVRWWRSVAVIATLAAVSLIIYNRVISNRTHRADVRHLEQVESLSWELNDLRSDLAAAQLQIDTLLKVHEQRVKLYGILMSPDLQLVRMAPSGPAPNASGIVAISNMSHAAMVQTFGLPPAPPGKNYELWWMTRQRGPVNAALFYSATGRMAMAPASMPPPGDRVMMVAVTLEPAGGVDKPTGETFLKGVAEGK